MCRRRANPHLRILGAMTLGGLVVAAGCSAPAASPEVTLTAVDSSLRAPVWSYATDSLVALTDDGRVAKVSDAAHPGSARTMLSEPLDAGRNLQISQLDDRHLFVPQPNRGAITVVDIADLRSVGGFDGGPAPDYLAEDAGMRILLALSADGTAVTPVDQYGYRKLPTTTIPDDRADSLDGANRGRAIEYHLYGPTGIRYFKGPSSPAEERGSLAVDVAATAGDGTKVTRSYVAGRDDDMLYAVDSRRSQEGLEIVGHARLPAPIRYLATDDTRLYAATDSELVTLQTASFTGYPHDTIPVLSVVDYRSTLPGERTSAPLSGMAVGPHRIYLTLAHAAVVVSVAKPRL